MMEKDIITRNKQEFLKDEYPFFPLGKKVFYQIMPCDAIACESCGVFYWNKCKKRCGCE